MMNQPLRGPDALGPLPEGSASRRPRTALPAPTPRRGESLEAPTSGRLRAAARTSEGRASDPVRLEQARDRLASGYYHSPAGIQAVAESMLSASGPAATV